MKKNILVFLLTKFDMRLFATWLFKLSLTLSLSFTDVMGQTQSPISAWLMTGGGIGLQPEQKGQFWIEAGTSYSSSTFALGTAFWTITDKPFSELSSQGGPSVIDAVVESDDGGGFVLLAEYVWLGLPPGLVSAMPTVPGGHVGPRSTGITFRGEVHGIAIDTTWYWNPIGLLSIRLALNGGSSWSFGMGVGSNLHLDKAFDVKNIVEEFKDGRLFVRITYSGPQFVKVAYPILVASFNAPFEKKRNLRDTYVEADRFIEFNGQIGLAIDLNSLGDKKGDKENQNERQ